MKRIFIATLCIFLTLTIVGCTKQDFDSAKTLTRIDVLELSEKGENLTWGDLKSFKHGRDIGSGLYIVVYDIDDKYGLMVGGGAPIEDEHPAYAYLINKTAEQKIDIIVDIMKENPNSFLN